MRGMFKFVKGDLLESEAYALVNTVNCEGVMGKGLAYQFKVKYPHMYEGYVMVCKGGEFTPGMLQVAEEEGKLIINFPTKDKWREKSKMEYITTGLSTLADAIVTLEIKSIAIPPLGCGCGGLEWNEVKPAILSALNAVSSDVDIFIYEPV